MDSTIALETAILSIKRDRDYYLRDSRSPIELIRDVRRNGWTSFILDGHFLEKFDDSDVAQFISALKSNHSIINLVISGINFDLTPQSAFPLFLAAGYIPTLRQLKIDECVASTFQIAALSLLIRRSKSLEKLDISLSCDEHMVYFAFNEIPDALCNHESVAELCLTVDCASRRGGHSSTSLSPPDFNDFFDRCSRLSQLRRFSFRQRDNFYRWNLMVTMTPSTLQKLVSSGIREIQLCNVEVTDDSSETSENKRVRYDSLQTLELNNVILSPMASELLHDACTRGSNGLSTLKIHDSTEMGVFPSSATINCVGRVVSCLGEESSIACLHVPGYEMEREASISLCQLPGKLSTLVELCFDQHFLSYDASVALAKSIKSSAALKHLCLRECRIAPEGCYALSQALTFNPPLEKLTVTGIFQGLPSECKQAFLMALAENNVLKALDISRNEFTRNEFFSMTQALSVGSGLEELTFTGWSGNGNGFLVLGRALFENENECLKSISIDGSFSLSDRGEAGLLDCQVLGNALEQNAFLQKLHLSSCGLSDSCCKALISGLGTNRALKEIWLGGNKFGDDSCSELAAVLRENDTLEIIDLTTCVAGEDSMLKIVDALKYNRTLRYFATRPEHIDEYGEAAALAILDLLKINHFLVFISVPCSFRYNKILISYYLRLNQLRRADIIRRSSVRESREIALKALSECLHDLDCIAYIVRASAHALFTRR